MEGVPYEQWARYLDELLVQFGLQPHDVLDLACGTGRVSRLLDMRGFSVTGVDASAGMIAEAGRLTPNGSIDYRVQRMEELSLDRRFDLIVSLFDSLNYLTDPRDLQSCFHCTADHLQPGGLFIFDMNGRHAFEADLFTQESWGRNRPVEYSWVSRFNPETRLCSIEMRFRVRRDGKREEFNETHVQRAYEIEEVNAALREARLEVAAVYDAYSTRPPRAKSDRVFWVARHPREDD